jgi:hypothetical protein
MFDAGTKICKSLPIRATVVPEGSFAECQRVAIFRAEKMARGANLFAAWRKNFLHTRQSEELKVSHSA